MGRRNVNIIGIKDVNIRADGSEAEITWLTGNQQELTMRVPALMLKKLMRGMIEIVTTLHSQTAISVQEMLDPRDFKPMPDFHIVEDFGLIESETSQQFQLRIKSNMKTEILLHFPPALYQKLLARIQDRDDRQWEDVPMPPNQSEH
jgi:hypothetical protein